MQNNVLIITIFRLNSEEMFVNCPEEGWQREAPLYLALLIWPGQPTAEALVPQCVLSLATTRGLSLARERVLQTLNKEKCWGWGGQGGGWPNACRLPTTKDALAYRKGRGWVSPWLVRLPLTPSSSSSLSTCAPCLTRFLICLLFPCSFCVAVAFTCSF